MSASFEVTNPRTGDVDYEIPVADRAEVAQVCGAVREAQPIWHALGLEERLQSLRR